MNYLLMAPSGAGSNDILNNGIFLAIIIVSVLIGIVAVVSIVARLIIFFTYFRNNRRKNSIGLTGKEAARKLLDEAQLQEVEVVKANWLVALIFGNSYRGRKKEIRLRRGIINKKSITSVGLACQKVGLALQDKEGDKKFRFKDRMEFITMFAPASFVPIVVVGLLVDIFAFKFTGWVTLIFLLIATIYFLLSFIVLLYTIPVEKKACKKALEIMEQTNFLNEEERGYINGLYKAYILAYICDFILALLYIIKMILKILFKMTKKSD